EINNNNNNNQQSIEFVTKLAKPHSLIPSLSSFPVLKPLQLGAGEMENHAVNQLPEVDSLPDGFVDSSADPLTPSSTPDQEDEVTDCKEGKQLGVDSRNDSVGDDFQSCEGDDGSAEQARALTVELSECGSCDAQKLVETPVEVCKDENDVGSPSLVSENVVGKSEQEMAPSTDGNKNAGETRQNSGKSNEQGVEVQAADAQGTLSSESSGTSRKDTSETKRKSAKRTFKSEKEFLEFTLSYQKVLSERDAAISMRDKLESLCRELQRQNKMLMDECKRVSTESQNLRLELSNKFQEAIKVSVYVLLYKYLYIGKIPFVGLHTLHVVFVLINLFVRIGGHTTTRCDLLRLELVLVKQRDGIKVFIDVQKKLFRFVFSDDSELIVDVTNKLEEQRDDSLTQLKENEMLRNQLKQKEQQIVLIEQQHAHQFKRTINLKQKTLELQIADLKIQQHEENLVKEQSQMKMYAEQVSQLLATEKNLRLQLNADGEKFQQFQVYFIRSFLDCSMLDKLLAKYDTQNKDALVKSNEVFETFKQEIEKMTKSIKDLKKENAFLKGKTEKSDITLIQLVEEVNKACNCLKLYEKLDICKIIGCKFYEQRERTKKQLEKIKNQKEKLESLCRSLQAERKQNPGGQSNADSVPLVKHVGSETAKMIEPKLFGLVMNLDILIQ
ncbi:hypothetical protein M8C21_016780, partial [Ambrosia artemisiifolia]